MHFKLLFYMPTNSVVWAERRDYCLDLSGVYPSPIIGTASEVNWTEEEHVLNAFLKDSSELWKTREKSLNRPG